MKKYDIIAFDLDGTLSDPKEGLVSGFVYAFKKAGIKYGDREALCRFIGPPIHKVWQEEFGVSYDEASKLVDDFREYYTVYGWWDNVMYDGIPELLSALKQSGKKIILTTSKPEEQAIKILNLFDISKYFDVIAGAINDKIREKKHEVIEYALEQLGAVDKSRVILVGDRKYDSEGAKIVGIDCLGVLYGHGSREEIEAADFTYTANTVCDVKNMLIF